MGLLSFLKKENKQATPSLSFKSPAPTPQHPSQNNSTTSPSQNTFSDDFDEVPQPPQQFFQAKPLGKQDDANNVPSSISTVDGSDPFQQDPFDTLHDNVQSSSQEMSSFSGASSSDRSQSSSLNPSQLPSEDPFVDVHEQHLSGVDSSDLDLPDLPDFDANENGNSLVSSDTSEEESQPVVPEMSPKKEVHQPWKASITKQASKSDIEYQKPESSEDADSASSESERYVEAKEYYDLLQEIKDLKKCVKGADHDLKKLVDAREGSESKAKKLFSDINTVQEELIAIDSTLFEG